MISLSRSSYSSDYIRFLGLFCFLVRRGSLSGYGFFVILYKWASQNRMVRISYHSKLTPSLGFSILLWLQGPKLSQGLSYNFEKGYYPRLKLFQGSSITFVVALLSFYPDDPKYMFSL